MITGKIYASLSIDRVDLLFRYTSYGVRYIVFVSIYPGANTTETVQLTVNSDKQLVCGWLQHDIRPTPDFLTSDVLFN